MPSPSAATARITPLPAFKDNYLWLLDDGVRAVVVDPGAAAPVLAALAAGALRLEAILLTHHHADHVGGVAELVAATGAQVFGPLACPYRGIDLRLRETDALSVLGTAAAVLEVPGHTSDHIAYWIPTWSAVFCGDTLFAGGCGRLFEGTAAQMWASLRKIAALPPQTLVYCAHEYTLANLRFALEVEPDNAALQQRQARCAQLRAQGKPTLPAVLAEELATNPFLRCAEPAVRAAAQHHDAACGTTPGAVFATLRAWKDRY